MSLKSLVELMQPPANPAEVPRASDWQSVEAKLGMELPEDYKNFITLYGTGATDNFLWVFNPFSRNDNLNLLFQANIRLEAQRQFLDAGGTTPFPLYPDANGLFPWGATDNGDVLFWRRKGNPSSWLILVCDSRASRWRKFQLSTTEFLTALLARKLAVDVFPDDFPSESPQFLQ